MDAIQTRRGDIWYAELPIITGSCVQGGHRPVLVVQNEYGNIFGQTTIVVPLTAQLKRNLLQTHVVVPNDISHLRENSTVLCEQIQTIDKSQLTDFVWTICGTDTMKEIDRAVKVSLQV